MAEEAKPERRPIFSLAPPVYSFEDSTPAPELTFLQRLNPFRKAYGEKNRNGVMTPLPIPLETYVPMAGNIDKTPVQAFAPKFLRDLAYNSDILNLVFRTKTNETFRNGLDIAARFQSKCTDCGREFEDEKVLCPFDGAPTRLPDYAQWKRLNTYAQGMNRNDESLLTLMRVVDNDLHILDNGWIYLERDYEFGENGEITGEDVVDLIRMDGAQMHLIMTRYGMGTSETGTFTYFCPMHRTEVLEFPSKGDWWCKKGGCGKQLIPAWYAALTRAEKMYYGPKEIYHLKLYSNTEGYGFSPLQSCYLKVSCYDDKTEVLTDGGWKLFKDVIRGVDKVMTLNADTREMSYQLPVGYAALPYEGKMYSVRNGSKVDLLVTPNHRMVTESKNGKVVIREASDVFGHQYRMFKDGLWVGEEREKYVIPGYHKEYRSDVGDTERTLSRTREPIVINMDDWLEFMGYFLSEGSLIRYRENGDTKKLIGVSIAQSKLVHAENYAKIKACLLRMGFEPCEEDKQMKVNNHQLAQHLFDIGMDGLAHDKTVPRELFGLSKRQLTILFDSMMLGDGCYASMSYATVSKQLADDFQELALKIGLAGDVTVRTNPSSGLAKANGTTKDTVVYTIGLKNKRSRRTALMRLNGNSRSDSWVDYNGTVYDVEVPGHILYVRRNGKAVWSGNTLMKMDTFIRDAYSMQRSPQELLILRGRAESIHRSWMYLMQKARENPNMVYPLVIEGGDEAGKNRMVEHETFALKPIEWQWKDMREEFRDVIGRLYGVQPIFSTTSGTSGGLNNEGLQLAVTSLSIKQSQAVWNAFLDFYSRQVGAVDYVFKLNPNEQEDEIRDLEVMKARLEVAKGLSELGYGNELHKDSKGRWDFTFSEKQEIEETPTLDVVPENEEGGTEEKKEIPPLDGAMTPEENRQNGVKEQDRINQAPPPPNLIAPVGKANYKSRPNKLKNPRGDADIGETEVTGYPPGGLQSDTTGAGVL